MFKSNESKIWFVAIVVIVWSFSVGDVGIAQQKPDVSILGQPTAFTHALQPIELVERVVTDPINLQTIRLEDQQREQDGAPYRFAIPRPVLITFETHGTWEEINDEIWLWRLRIFAPGAQSLNIGFTRYRMPPGGNLFIYAADRSQVLGPFAEDDNEDHGQLWTPIVLSDEIIVELTVPVADVPQVELELTAINHGYRGFKRSDREKSGACNIDVICPESDGWRDQIRSVAVYSFGGSLLCTGALINNTAGNGTPYFLTANHCGIDVGNAASMVVYWNYEKHSCGSGSGSLSQNQTGAYLRASYSPSDFTLVELDDDTDPNFDVYFAGWSRSSIAPPNAVVIHHPSADEKSISFEYDSTCISGWPIGEDHCGGGTDHIRVNDWDLGTTEAGSSGSPLFDPNRRIVGQLHGGSAACDNNEPDWFGRLYTSWTGGGTNSTRLSNWLDPLGTGAVTLDGMNLSSCQSHYYSTDVPKTIPDPGTTTSTLNIIDTGTIFDLNVKLNITHIWDNDLDVYLIAPDSTRVELFTDVGNSGDNFSNTILDDEASTAISSGSAPFTGSYSPEGSLSDFDDKSITGTWTLEVTDDTSADIGTLNSWSLIIETCGPEGKCNITIGTDALTWSYPMHTFYHDSRTQVIYLASEIGINGTIEALAVDVNTVPGQTMNNWTIRMKHTNMSSYSTASLEATDWTVVYQANEPVGTIGWRTFTFSTPFEYNGTDNLLVDFSHNNSSWSSDGTCRYSIPGGTRSAYAYTDSGYGDPLTWSGTSSPSVSGSSNVPNVQLTVRNPGDFDNNCIVNFGDFAIFSSQWLQPPGSPSADIAPEVPDGIVDILDLAVFAENWLVGAAP